MKKFGTTVAQSQQSVLATNSVLRNTYLLLGLTLLFSGLCAWWAMTAQVRPVGFLIILIGAYGLMFLTFALRNSPWGILTTFGFTGFMGYTLGPILTFYMKNYINGGELIMMAAGGTGLLFLGLSAYALISRKNLSFLGNFIFVGIWVLIIGMIAGFFLHMTALQLALSVGFIIFSSAVILYQTSSIIHGGERNYIMATITLYVSIYNIFVSLLSILGFAGGRD